MSGPVSPPLLVELRDNTSQNRPVYTLQFLESEFSLTNTGTKTLVSLSGGGGGGTIGGSITEGQVAFGAATADEIEGSANFTFVDEAGGSGPNVALKGGKPILTISDDDEGATIYTTKLLKSGHNFIMYNSTTSDIEYMRFGSSSIIVNDSGINLDFRVESEDYSEMFLIDAEKNKAHFGTGGIDSNLGLVQINVGNSTQNALTVSSTDSDAASAPTIELYRNSSSAVAGDSVGIIEFSNNNDAGKDLAGSIGCQIDSVVTADSTSMQFKVKRSGVEVDNFRIRYSEVVVNEDSTDCDFRVETNGNAYGLHVDAANDTVGIGGIGASEVALHVFDDADQDTVVRIESDNTDAGSGPNLQLYRNPQQTAVGNDDIGKLEFYGPDGSAGGTPREYGSVSMEIQGVTSGSEHGRMMFKIASSGTITEMLRFSASGIEFNAFEQNIDFKISTDLIDGFFKIDASEETLEIGTTSGGSASVADNYTPLQVGGAITGKAPIIVTGSATSITLTNDQMSGHVLWFGTASNVTIVLPNGVTGDHIKVIMPSGDVAFQPTPSGQINGGVAGVSISRNSAQNEILEFICVATNKWYLNNP